MKSDNRNIVLCLTLLVLPAFSAPGRLYKEFNFIGGYSDAQQWISRNPGLRNSLGFEYFKKFSDEYGDYLTLDLQVRLAYDPSDDFDPTWAIEIHNAWLEYKLGLGKSLKFGHLAPAFGLESDLDTHGKLLQTLAFDNLGFKKDWGLAYKTIFGDYDLEVTGTIGSGMAIRRKDDSYLISARLSKGSSDEFRYGMSFLHGRVLKAKEPWTIPAGDLAMDNAIEKTRMGIDMQFPINEFVFKAELAAGCDNGTTVGGGLAQLEYTPPDNQDITLKLQTKYWADELDNKKRTDLTLAPVVEWKMNRELTFRAGYFQDIVSKDNEEKRLLLQLYYYGI